MKNRIEEMIIDNASTLKEMENTKKAISEDVNLTLMETATMLLEVEVFFKTLYTATAQLLAVLRDVDLEDEDGIQAIVNDLDEMIEGKEEVKEEKKEEEK